MPENTSFITDFLEEAKRIVETISASDIDAFINALYNAWKEGRKVFIAGNGGSASTATHFASDLAKFASVEGKPRFKAYSLVDNTPLMTALTNDLGWSEVYVEQLKNMMSPGDVFVAISVHGGSGMDKAGVWSQNLLKAAKYVKDNGGKVLSLVGFDGGVLRQISNASILVPANSTPHVEGFHVVLTHMICARLKQVIAQS
jgi:D-sedoheptulose 7-phosphate isomerase